MEYVDLSQTGTNGVKNANKKRGDSCISAPSRKKISRNTESALLDLKNLGDPLIASTIRLETDKPCTIGRSARLCQLVFNDRRVSKQHCQILFDASLRKLYLLDGAFSLSPATSSLGSSYIPNRYRNGLGLVHSHNPEARVRASLNGVFVNGVRITKGLVFELSAGDEVLLVCANNRGLCGSRLPVGFSIQRIVFEGALLDERNNVPLPITFHGHSQAPGSSGKSCERIFALKANSSASSRLNRDALNRANFLSTWCRDILQSDDPISCIRRYPFSVQRSPVGENPSRQVVAVKIDSNHHTEKVSAPGDHSYHKDCFGIPYPVNPRTSSLSPVGKDNPPHCDGVEWNKTSGNICPPPGKNFYLNRLQNLEQNLPSHHAVVSLPELLHPVESISRIFIATFTSDILWFLSYCKIPCHLPVTLACHDTERCWSSAPDKRSSVPYPDFPNLVVVYPPFPEAVAFGKDSKKQGIACHHPKLLVSQRENSIRVIITSANLVANQWKKVTNTIWWQDFPRRSSPDYSSLFTQISGRDIHKDSNSDFAAMLARFMASLVTDVPSQVHWVIELTKYDFGRADGHLIASAPGIHSYIGPSMIESTQFLPANHWASSSSGVKFLGSAEASVVGLSHLFQSATDSNGVQLKKLAAFLGKSCGKAYVMSEIVLRRNKNVPADPNAVSVLVPNPDEFSKGDCVQLGFLPRNVAKWVSPLWDIGFFRFSGCICPTEALAAALGRNGMNTRLILYVSQGPYFQDISKMMQLKHGHAFCSLIASVQGSFGLWRLQEVLDQYRWPESLESDFIYGSSSIGSINPQFLAAFATASGKRSLRSFDSEESDPEWGCWNASQELKSPSIRIIFPTIERVKDTCSGILSAKRILCFSEKTWQRLRTVDILYDAIPHPYNRVGHPIHVKVARRRFVSKIDAVSVGWVYCGSHNFSAAAWGRPISHPFGSRHNGFGRGNSPLGGRLRICNYELGIIFIFPPSETKVGTDEIGSNLDDIAMPFVVPAPKYGPRDRPATGQAMREALAELNGRESEKYVEVAATEGMTEEMPDEEEEAIEAANYVAKEKEEEKAYAEMLWSQVDSSQSS